MTIDKIDRNYWKDRLDRLEKEKKELDTTDPLFLYREGLYNGMIIVCEDVLTMYGREK